MFDNAASRGNWTLIIDEVETIFGAVSALNTVHKETLSKIFDDPLAAAVNDVIDKTENSFNALEKFMKNEETDLSTDALQKALQHLNSDLERFRATRTTRKFNLEDVESYFVYFHSLKSIGDAVIKMENIVNTIGEVP